jgi:3D-(3,5/4)-trihydroxycyclohexane-1,2-dione acylhydrolase (decyclizing)
VAEAVELIKSAKRPLIISGGGVRYSLAGQDVSDFALKHGIPMAETNAGKGAVTHDHPAHVGPLGVIGSSSANEMAGAADVIIAIGTRLQDFTTGSWTVFGHDAKFVSINAARYDAVKHRALSVVGDARETILEIGAAMGGWKADASWMQKGKTAFKGWNDLLDKHQTPTNAAVPSYAQVVGIVNAWAGDNDTMVTASGGLPGETAKGWRIKNPNTYDLEFGFSAMGYEIAGGWGHAMAKNGDGETIVMVGDGAYLLMNSDIYSTVLTGHKMIVVVCDNGGYAVINRLQNFKGTPSFNNLIKDSRVKKPFAVDFVKHAQSMGAEARHVESLGDLEAALKWAKTTDRTTVISIVTDAFEWMPGDADWDVGVPEVSSRPEVQKAREHHDTIRKKQRIGV